MDTQGKTIARLSTKSRHSVFKFEKPKISPESRKRSSDDISDNNRTRSLLSKEENNFKF